jgi:quinol-cytochrome oxidoreductase complex cytochrome b subunit
MRVLFPELIPLFCNHMISRMMFGLAVFSAVICTIGAINSLFSLVCDRKNISHSIRQRHTWLIGSVTTMFLLCFGSFIGGWGPCGPGSDIGRYCAFGVPLALLISIISYAVVVYSLKQEQRKRKVQSPPFDPR